MVLGGTAHDGRWRPTGPLWHQNLLRLDQNVLEKPGRLQDGRGSDRGSVEPEDTSPQGTSHVALGGVGAVQEADLQRDGAIFSQVQSLQLPVGGPVPDMEGRSVETWNKTLDRFGSVQGL